MGEPMLTAAQRAAMVGTQMGGGWPGYLSRLRESHRPTFGMGGATGALVYRGCSCGGGLCAIPHLLAHVADLVVSYEGKVEDFASETRRVTLHRDALWWVLNGVRHDQSLDGMLADGYAPPEVMEIVRSVADSPSPDGSPAP